MEPLDLALFDEDEMRAALADRDIGKVYRSLRRLGISQRQIAQLTGQSQSEVSEIIVKGRQVRDVRVLERIADGLGIPRARLGVSFSYGEEPAPPSQEEVDEDVKRRVLIATATTSVVGQLVVGGEPPELALPREQPLPSRLGISDVHTVRAVTEQLRGVARDYGGQGDMFGAAVGVYTPWLQVPASEVVKMQLAAALAEMHTEAGWWCYDGGLDGTGHFTRALRLASKARDVYGVANAALHAGATLVRSGHPNDALKLFQLGQFHLRMFPPRRSTPGTVPADDPRLVILAAQLSRQSATAYAVMKGPDEADHYLAEANDGWDPHHAFQRAGAALVAAGIQLDLGRLEAAEQLAANAARTYDQGHHRRGRIEAELIVAEAHVRAGESQGLALAHHAIEAVSTLHSIAARRERLVPLATALEARPGADARELARTARQSAACGAAASSGTNTFHDKI